MIKIIEKKFVQLAVLFFTILILRENALTQTFELQIIGENNEQLQCITKIHNGLFISAGTTNSTPNNELALVVTCFDNSGEVLSYSELIDKIKSKNLGNGYYHIVVSHNNEYNNFKILIIN